MLLVIPTMIWYFCDGGDSFQTMDTWEESYHELPQHWPSSFLLETFRSCSTWCSNLSFHRTPIKDSMTHDRWQNREDLFWSITVNLNKFSDSILCFAPNCSRFWKVPILNWSREPVCLLYIQLSSLLSHLSVLRDGQNSLCQEKRHCQGAMSFVF